MSNLITDNTKVEMYIAIVDNSKDVYDLMNIVKYLKYAANIAKHRSFVGINENFAERINPIIKAIELKHKELLNDPLDADEEDVKLIESIDELNSIKYLKPGL